ncbi:hypothetical protein ASG14_07355 [Pedobacter sp. Leaf194]|nr:hypothetical protein ASG14_07355 [Pedobacter sp. Leaf194]
MPSGVVPVTSYGQQDVPHFQEPQPVQPSVMGLSKTPQGLRSSSISEVSFAPETNGEVGLKSDIIAELKEIFTLLAENDGDKGDFLGLLEAMKLRYPPMASHPACAQINSFIKAHAPFLLSKQELENIWD